MPGRVRRGALAILAAGVAGCALPGDDGDRELPPQPALAHEWGEAIRDMGRFPVFPPTEDMYVGDVFAFPATPSFDWAGGSEGQRAGATSRWKSLHVLSDLDAEYRQRPGWSELTEAESLYRADRVPVRHRIVGLKVLANVTLAAADLEPFLPAEVVPLIAGPATSERFVASFQAGEAESYSLSVDTLIEQLVDTAQDGEGTVHTLKWEHLRALPLVADASTGMAYLGVVSEVLYIGSLDATLRARQPRGPGEPGGREAETAAIRRAAEMNEALAESGIEDRIDGALEFLMVTDDALTLRRSWPHPLAVAVRGVTLEVDVSTGEVRRMGPLGLELPALEAAREVELAEEESQVLEARRRGAAIEEPSPQEGPRKGLSWDYGPRFDALDGELNLFLGGRLHLDAATFSQDDEIDAAFGEPDPGTTVRRAFLELGGVYRQYEFNLWLNFSENDLDGQSIENVDFRNVFVGMRNVPLVGSVRAGYFKEPFGLEETTSSNDITFMERSLTDAFIERRNLGVMFQRRFTAKRRMTTALGVYRSANNDLDTGTGYGVTGRITGAPILAEDGRRVLHLGASATYRDPGADGLQFSQKPESAQAQLMANTGMFAAGRDIRVGAEFGAVLGSLSFQSEAIVASSEGGTGAGDPTFWSTYVMGSYVLTGEHRSYRERVGAFGSVHPDRPLRKRGWGAVEVAGRYSYLDLDSGGVDGGKLHDWTLGLNWYADTNMRVMFNYIAARPEGFDFEHILQARLQLTF